MGKKKETAYSLYVKELRRDKNLSLQDAYSIAANLWENMDNAARQKYVDLAKKLKASTSAPLPVENPVKDEEDQKHAMKEDITSTINLAHGRVSELDFYVIHINHYFYVNSEKKYYPAEIGVARFNLRDGVKTKQETNIRGETETKASVYHAFCNPGRLPTGYAGDVQSTDHKMPYPGRDEKHHLETRTEKEIFDDIVAYLSDGLHPNQQLPPLYTSKKNMPYVTKIVNWWLKQYNYEEDYIKIYSMEELFFQLNLATSKIRSDNNAKKGKDVAEPEVFNGAVHAGLLISKDYFDFTPGIACDFHELSDVINHCSKSYVTRWVYLICNYCCDPEDMIPVQHMPKNAQTKSCNNANEAWGYQ